MKKIIIIDADSLIYIHSYINREEDDFFVHKESISSAINEIINITKADAYIGFLTVMGSFRKSFATSKEYKGNRKYRPKPKFYYDYVQFLMEEWKFKAFDQLEADDLCYIAWKEYKDTYDVIVASPDKDLKQFPCNFYDYKKETESIISEQDAAYNFWYQVLIGDSADNIIGARGVGPVAASKALTGKSIEEMPLVALSEFIRVNSNIIDASYFFYESIKLIKLADLPSTITDSEKEDLLSFTEVKKETEKKNAW